MTQRNGLASWKEVIEITDAQLSLSGPLWKTPIANTLLYLENCASSFVLGQTSDCPKVGTGKVLNLFFGPKILLPTPPN